MAPVTSVIDEAKLGAFLGTVLGDLGATISTAMVVLGDRLGLYKALAGAGPLTQRTWPHLPAPASAMCASGC